jgi:hypothetical protein
MAGNLQPLVSNQRIVNQDGTPTEYFIRWAQAKQIDLQGAVTAAQALEIAQTYVDDFLADHPLSAGSGIALTPPDGNIGHNISVAAQVQEILDQISTTRGTVLFRGAADWEALAPGTAGKVLQTNGAGADPTWVTPAGGGGGALARIAQVIVTGAPAANISFTAIPATYEDLILVLDGQLTGPANFVWGSLNGDTAANYQWARGYFQTSGIGFSTGTAIGLDIGLIDGAGTVAGSYGGTLECTLYNYARTLHRKRSMARSALRTTAAAAGLSTEIQTSEWSGTAAVNAWLLTPDTGSFVVGTVATLYGRG